ncbi:MAG: hypothetical protein M3362_17445, partial [Acidobacteriota bacterium]|nr:hypothetical protein [Acidobacteriota bacterium]
MTLAAKQLEVQALAVWDAIHAGTPDFIMTAIIDALDAAARSKGLPRPLFAEDKTETREEAIEKIKEIFARARDYKPVEIKPDSNEALAHHISAVLNHPRVPAEVHNELWEATT